MNTFLILFVALFFSIQSMQAQDNYTGKFSDKQFYRQTQTPIPLGHHIGFDESEGLSTSIQYGVNGAFQSISILQGSDTICFKQLDFPNKQIEWIKIEEGIWINSIDKKEEYFHYFDTNDEVKMHYAGFLENGEAFDNSFIRNKPLKGYLKRFIKGFAIGAINVKPNSIRILKIAPDQAYGSKGGGNIPQNSTIYYVVYNLENPKV